MLLTLFKLPTSEATTPLCVESEKRFIIPIVEIEITSGYRAICAGTSVTFTATPTHGGLRPLYQWQKNGVNVGSNEVFPFFTSTTLANGDVITCVMTSNDPAVDTVTALSNGITMSVDATPRPSIHAVPNQTLCAGERITPITFTGTGVNTYTWISNTDSIGIQTEGVNKIAAFVARNPTRTPMTATITVTPKSGSNGYFYVNRQNYRDVAVFDKTNQFLKTIPLTGFWSWWTPSALAVSPKGDQVYVVNPYPGEPNLAIINTATNTVIATIPVGINPIGLSVTPDGNSVYVSNKT